MKKEELKKAFDTVSPTMAQKEKMLANIISAENVSAKRFKLSKVVSFVAVAAVVLTVGIVSVRYVSYNNNTSIATAEKPQSDKTNTDSNKTFGYMADSAEDFDAEERKQSNTNQRKNATPQSEQTNDKNVFFTDEQKKEQLILPKEEAAIAEDAMEDVKEEQDLQEIAGVTDKVFQSDRFASPPNISAGGGGSGGGGSAASATEKLTLEQIRSHPGYSKVFPRYFPNGFRFAYANWNTAALQAVLLDATGRSIIITVRTSYPQPTISPESILELKGDIRCFVLKCDEYYIAYYAETDDNEELYKMAVSPEYFN